MDLLVVLGIIAAPAVGAMVSWAVKGILPEKPAVRHLVAVGASLVVLATFLAISRGNEEGITFAVDVRNETGESVSAADVVLYAKNLEETSLTDSAGIAVFGLPGDYSGQYAKIEVRLEGYMNSTRHLQITSGILPYRVDLTPEATLDSGSEPSYRWKQVHSSEEFAVVYGRNCHDPSYAERLECNETSLGERVVKAPRNDGSRLLEHKSIQEAGYGTGHAVVVEEDVITWFGGRHYCGDDLRKAVYVELYECVEE